MRYVRLGGSGLEVSELCLGCMGVGEPGRGTHPWTVGAERGRRLIRHALEAGITFFDTANTYSDGSSEEILGAALATYARREEVVIATKVGLPVRRGPNSRGLSRKVVHDEVERSLRRLGTDYIDVYQPHRFDPSTPVEESVETLAGLVRAGKVRYLGASSMPAWQFAKLAYAARALGAPPFVSMQSHYNVLYREEEREMLPLCADLSVGVLPWSPLARGVLTRPWGAADERARGDDFQRVLYGPADRPMVDLVAEIAKDHGRSMAEVALAWIARRPGVVAPIVGVTETAHLDQAVAALELALSPDDLARLDTAYVPHTVAGIEVLPLHA